MCQSTKNEMEKSPLMAGEVWELVVPHRNLSPSRPIDKRAKVSTSLCFSLMLARIFSVAVQLLMLYKQAKKWSEFRM